jgi:hypothetical protein
VTVIIFLFWVIWVFDHSSITFYHSAKNKRSIKMAITHATGKLMFLIWPTWVVADIQDTLSPTRRITWSVSPDVDFEEWSEQGVRARIVADQ